MQRNMFLKQCWQLLFIMLLIQQRRFVCHGSWATRTNVEEAPAALSSVPVAPVAPTVPPIVLVSASEATLLTMRRYASPPALRHHQNNNNNNNNESNDNDVETMDDDNDVATNEMLSAQPVSKRLKASHGVTAKRRYRVLAVRTHCTRDLFDMRLELNRAFRGLLYAKDFPLECRARGLSNVNITLRLPTSGCGVRAEPRSDGGMELSVRVMLQTEQKLRQSSDILRTVRCQLPANAMGMTVAPTAPLPNDNQLYNFRNGRMRPVSFNAEADTHLNDNSTENNGSYKNDKSSQDARRNLEEKHQTTEQMVEENVESGMDTVTPTMKSTRAGTKLPTVLGAGGTPRVRIWLELGGSDGSGAVEVGQPTTLTVRAIVPGTMGVRVVDCAALDGLGESTQQLLDEHGCPIDEQVNT